MHITVDVDNHGNWNIVPDPAKSKASLEEFFTWSSDSGSLTITFPHGNHPFKTNPNQSVGPHAHTVPVQVDKRKVGTYKYNVEVVAHGTSFPKDPQVIIDPGIGPDVDLTQFIDIGVVEAVTEKVMEHLVKTLKDASSSKDDPIKFFPQGINLISVDVEVDTIKVILKVAGPNVS